VNKFVSATVIPHKLETKEEDDGENSSKESEKIKKGGGEREENKFNL
jgi:hypothetical protein